MTQAAVLTQSAASNQAKSSGIVYITDVFSEQGNVRNNYKPNTIIENSIVESITTDTKILSVEIHVETTDIFIPIVTINGIEIDLTHVSDKIFKGTLLNFNFDTETQIVVRSSNGGLFTANINYINEQLTLEEYTIIGVPIGQTTFKENDEIQISGRLSGSGYISILDQGAFKRTDFVKTDLNNEFVITGAVSNRNGDLPIVFVCKSDLGTYGQVIVTHDKLPIENIIFDISSVDVEYPLGQNSLKGQEFGYLNIYTSMPINDTDYLVEYISRDNSVSFFNPNKFDNRKRFYSLINSNLESNDNIVVRITKKSNHFSNEIITGVNIINMSANIQFIGANILDSGDGEKTHHFVIQSDIELKSIQRLNNLDDKEITIYPIVQPKEYSKTFEFDIKVRDISSRGQHTINYEYMTSSGEVFSASFSFVVAGFNERIVTISKWPVRQAVFGIEIFNPDKLKVTNLSKSTDMTYKDNIENAENMFSIVDLYNHPDLKGKVIYNCDLHNCVSNTSGELKISIQETI